jgi:hypothetical protein
MARKTTVYKSDDKDRVRGNPLTPDELKGPVGDAVRKAIEDADGADGKTQVDGHHFVWFSKEDGDADHPVGVN